jgi:hypothetical protein
LTTIPNSPPNHTLCRLSSELFDLDEKRKKISAINATVEEEGWELIDYKNNKYKHREVPPEAAALLFMLTNSLFFPLKLVEVFLKFYTWDLMVCPDPEGRLSEVDCSGLIVLQGRKGNVCVCE